jgi:hypothetical protein
MTAKRQWRATKNRNIGAFITEAGRAVVSVELPTILQENVAVANVNDSNVQGLAGVAPVSLASPRAAPRPTKQTLTLDLLKRDGGASLVELAAATGWLPHTMRAALTGLRKKGHPIVAEKTDGVTRYRIAAGA